VNPAFERRILRTSGKEASMKAFVLAASAAAIAVALPASAAVLTVGGSFAEGCFRYAESRVGTADAVETCDRAFTDQALSYEDEFATHVNRGIVRMHRREFTGAQADFDRAVAMIPNRGEPWTNMGVLRLKQGDSAGAIPLFDKALALGTEVPEVAYYGRGLAHEDQGNLNAAYADLRKAVELRPKWTEPARELARYQVRRR
jgi:tetratricopeptide (TPR) repeat protein